RKSKSATWIACWTVIWINLSRRTCKPGRAPRDGKKGGNCEIGGILHLNFAQHPNGNSPPKLGGVARRRFISRAGVVPTQNHPVCAQPRRLRDILLMGAATPPNLGGEFPCGCFATFGIILVSPMQQFCPTRSGVPKFG